MVCSSILELDKLKSRVIAEFERCWPWLESAMLRGVPAGVVTHHKEDVLQMVLAGDAQLWSTPDGAMVTYVTTFPRARFVQIWLLGGDFDQVMLHHEQAVIEWAKGIGAALLYVQGRKGWLRRLMSRGFKQHQAIVCMELNNALERPDGAVGSRHRPETVAASANGLGGDEALAGSAGSRH